MERESKVKGQSCGESDEQEKPQSTRGSRMVARTITTLTLADLFAFYALLAGWPLTCDASWYLKAWLIVGLLLSWPASGLVAWLGIMQSFRRAFMLEPRSSFRRCPSRRSTDEKERASIRNYFARCGVQ
eukprot:TRINITY_DN16187_c0_g1_i2.p2 TRINITY_DN16187_c0_g1~~TRINITY_DN16187_c0_g1_i2.p2  ORF type:complete len:129 (-),score=16.66 TRINITY_DN16187_c0_g1_i2:261-647(-)